jgi:hypothetical protein
MTEASHRLQQAKLLASMSNATRTLALQRAMWATKRQLHAQGLKVNFFPHRELVSRAEQYNGTWRVSSANAQNLQHSISTGRLESSALSLCECYAQNSSLGGARNVGLTRTGRSGNTSTLGDDLLTLMREERK